MAQDGVGGLGETLHLSGWVGHVGLGPVEFANPGLKMTDDPVDSTKDVTGLNLSELISQFVQ